VTGGQFKLLDGDRIAALVSPAPGGGTTPTLFSHSLTITYVCVCMRACRWLVTSRSYSRSCRVIYLWVRELCIVCLLVVIVMLSFSVVVLCVCRRCSDSLC